MRNLWQCQVRRLLVCGLRLRIVSEQYSCVILGREESYWLSFTLKSSQCKIFFIIKYITVTILRLECLLFSLCSMFVLYLDFCVFLNNMGLWFLMVSGRGMETLYYVFYVLVWTFICFYWDKDFKLCLTFSPRHMAFFSTELLAGSLRYWFSLGLFSHSTLFGLIIEKFL